MGYEYELLQAFAEDHDLELRVEVVSDRDSLFYLLNSGVGDVVAARVVPAVADTNRIRFTQALYETAPGLVQRSGLPSEVAVPESVDSALEAIVPDTSIFHAFGSTDQDSVELQARLIRRPSELAGETVHLMAQENHPDRYPFVARALRYPEDGELGSLTFIADRGTATSKTGSLEQSRPPGMAGPGRQSPCDSASVEFRQ